MNVPIGLIQSTKSGTPIEQWAHVSGPRSGVLYDSKIKPLMPYAIRGFTWYQGEDNAKDSTDVYLAKLEALIGEWRTAWAQGNFPFGIVQLPFGRKPATQEAQLRAFLTVEETFLAVTTDLPSLGGTAGHPANKEPVGVRLAIGTRAIAYGEGTEPVGPIRDPAASHVSGNKVVIGFTHLGDGLVTGSEWQPGGDPVPFRLAGSNGTFYAATAKIVGNTVEVTSPSVPNPVSVRYTYTYGMGNLYSAVDIPIEGGAATYTRLPASPFELRIGPQRDDLEVLALGKVRPPPEEAASEAACGLALRASGPILNLRSTSGFCTGYPLNDFSGLGRSGTGTLKVDLRPRLSPEDVKKLEAAWKAAFSRSPSFS